MLRIPGDTSEEASLSEAPPAPALHLPLEGFEFCSDVHIRTNFFDPEDEYDPADWFVERLYDAGGTDSVGTSCLPLSITIVDESENAARARFTYRLELTGSDFTEEVSIEWSRRQNGDEEDNAIQAAVSQVEDDLLDRLAEWWKVRAPRRAVHEALPLGSHH